MTKRMSVLVAIGGAVGLGGLAGGVGAVGKAASASSCPYGAAMPGLSFREVKNTRGYHVPYKFSNGPAPVVLDACRVGIPDQQGDGVSDVSALRLTDGRIRLYFCIQGGSSSGGIYSAISSDSVHFTLEPGARVSSGCSAYVYPLPGGGYRMFYGNGGGPTGVGPELSATSSDGLTFTQDPGVRVQGTTFVHGPSNHLVCTAIVPLPGRRYRMYCSQGIGHDGKQSLFSATSSDLLHWTPDPGRRIGPGALLSVWPNHPTVVASNLRGPVTLIFWSSNTGVTHEIMASSKNGLKFTQQADTLINGTEASALTTPSGRLLLYYGGSDYGGNGSSAILLNRGKRSR